MSQGGNRCFLFSFTLQYKRMNYSYSATLQYALQLGNMIDAVSENNACQICDIFVVRNYVINH